MPTAECDAPIGTFDDISPHATPDPVVAWAILTRPIRAGDSVTVEDGKLLVIRRAWWKRVLRG